MIEFQFLPILEFPIVTVMVVVMLMKVTCVKCLILIIRTSQKFSITSARLDFWMQVS